MGASLLLGGVAACSSGPTGPGLKMQVAESAGDLTCKRGTAGVPFKSLLQAGTLRLSVLRRDPDGTRLQCDLSTAVPSMKPSIDLGPVDRSRLDLFAEFFDQSGKRVLSGAALGSTTIGADGTAQTLPLFPVGDWGCPASVMSTARAFHSATLLPSGEVLLLGGIEPITGYGADVFGVIGSAEIYDPRKGVFVPLTVPSGALTPRAFHQAAVLSATDTQVRILAYGGVTAMAHVPMLVVANSSSTIRLSPAGNATTASSELLVYDPAAHTLTPTALQTGHSTAFAGGSGLPGGGLLVAGGSSFMASGAFNRANPTSLMKNTEVVGATAPSIADMPSFVFSGTAQTPWLLGPSVTPLSQSTALALGAPVSGTNMLALQMSGLPKALSFVTEQGNQVTGDVATVYHTATRLGPPITDANVAGPAKILVTGGFQMTAQPPAIPGQPPPPAQAVRLYTVADPMGAIGPVSYTAVSTYGATNMCGVADGHYRPAGFEAASATPSGQKVLVTGGTPQAIYGANPCIDCEPTDMVTGKLLCVLSQASIYDATANTFTAAPKLSLGRSGHQQTTLRDGSILVTGGLVRPSTGTESTAEAEIFNPRSASADSLDPEDPVNAVLDDGQKAMRQGMGLASPCGVL